MLLEEREIREIKLKAFQIIATPFHLIDSEW